MGFCGIAHRIILITASANEPVGIVGVGWQECAVVDFLQVYNAGHMVPGDQPEQACSMMLQFLNGESF